MSTAIFTTQITRRYLMNKSKSDMADLTLWILDLKCKQEEEVNTLLTKVTECLDDENIKGAMELLRAYEKAHQPFEK